MGTVVFLELMGSLGGCVLSVVCFLRGVECANAIVNDARVILVGSLNILIGVFLLMVCLEYLPGHVGPATLTGWLMSFVLLVSWFWGFGGGMLTVYLNRASETSSPVVPQVLYSLKATAEVEQLFEEYASSWRRDMLYPALDELKDQLEISLAPVVTVEMKNLGRIKILRRSGQVSVSSTNSMRLEQLPLQLRAQGLCFERTAVT